MTRLRALAGISVLALVLAVVLTVLFGTTLWSVIAVQAVQGNGGLKTPMALLSFLGTEEFYLVLLPLLYWCINKGLGADLGVLLVFSGFINSALKAFFKHPRPFWENFALKLSDETSFSLPSGHAQNSTAIFGYLAWSLAGGSGRAHRRGLRRVGAALLVLLIILISLSRVYLGVHFPGDVLWGAVVGAGIVAAYTWLKPRLLPRLRELSVGTHVLLALITAVVMLGVEVLLLSVPFGTGSMFGGFYPEVWGATLDSAATLAGLALGLWVGLALEARYVRFAVKVPLWKRGLRYLIGLVGLFAIWTGLRVLFPQEPLELGLALRVVRYACAMLWAIVGWPWLFVRFKL